MQFQEKLALTCFHGSSGAWTASQTLSYPEARGLWPPREGITCQHFQVQQPALATAPSPEEGAGVSHERPVPAGAWCWGSGGVHSSICFLVVREGPQEGGIEAEI